MTPDHLPYRIFSLGDSAITLEFGTAINSTINDDVIAGFYQLQQNPFPGMMELVPAYCTLTVYFDIGTVRKNNPGPGSASAAVKKIVEEKLQGPVRSITKKGRLMKIPVCYEEEFAPDMQHLSAKKNISVSDIIAIHQSKTYRVYMLGFLPGFAYMGEVDERISMPRKKEPVPIAAGSVGIAGVQTGIYPFVSPGGWQIIGRTPLKLFNAGREDPVLLNAGDTVQFYSVSIDEFHQLENDSLF